MSDVDNAYQQWLDVQHRPTVQLAFAAGRASLLSRLDAAEKLAKALRHIMTADGELTELTRTDAKRTFAALAAWEDANVD